MIGTELAKAGRHDEAVPHLREAARELITAQYDLGAELFSVGKYDESITALSKYLNAAPGATNVADTHFIIARAFVSLGRWTDAEQHLRIVTAARPDDVDAEGLLGEALVRQGQYAQAVPHLRRYLTTHRANASVCVALGIALASLRDKEAPAAFRCAVDADPANVHFRLNLASSLLEQGEFSQAEQQAREATSLDPRMSDSFVTLARALAAQGRLSEARTALSRALDLDPGSGAARDLMRVLTSR